MSETSAICELATCKATGRCICSRVSAAGLTPSISPAGPQLDLFGQPVAPVSRSRRPESEKPDAMIDICGPISFGSSASAALQHSLASRLVQSLDTDGSPEYVMTWKRRAMRSGAPICRLAAKGRRTSETGCSWWPTAAASDGKRGHKMTEKQRTRKRGQPRILNYAAALAGWPTPRVAATRTSVSALNRQDSMSAWSLEQAAELASGIEPREASLLRPEMKERLGLAGWATPTERDYRHPNAKSLADRGGGKKGEQLANQVVHSGPTADSSSAETSMNTAGTASVACLLNPLFPSGSKATRTCGHLARSGQ
jgi:hypothetical protein